MSFESWVNSADKDLEEAIGKNIHNKDLWPPSTNGIFSHKAYLLPHYLQYKIWKSNKWLVIATWILAISTIVLAGITYFF